MSEVYGRELRCDLLAGGVCLYVFRAVRQEQLESLPSIRGTYNVRETHTGAKALLLPVQVPHRMQCLGLLLHIRSAW